MDSKFNQENINDRLESDSEYEMITDQNIIYDQPTPPLPDYPSYFNYAKSEYEKTDNTAISTLEAESSLVQLWTRSPEKNELLIRQKQAIRFENSNMKSRLRQNSKQPTATTTVTMTEPSETTPTTTVQFDDFEHEGMETQHNSTMPHSTTTNNPPFNLPSNIDHSNLNTRELSPRNINFRESTQRDRSPHEAKHRETDNAPSTSTTTLSIFKRAPSNQDHKKPQNRKESKDGFFEGFKRHRTFSKPSEKAILPTKQANPSETPAEVSPEHVRPLIVILWCGAYCLASALQHIYYNYF